MIYDHYIRAFSLDDLLFLVDNHISLGDSFIYATVPAWLFEKSYQRKLG